MASAQVDDITSFLDAEDLAALAGASVDFNTLNDEELDQTGEKAGDAEDFGDISDEDLAEDETGIKSLVKEMGEDEADEDDDDDLDALFGDGPQSPTRDAREEPFSPADSTGLLKDSASPPTVVATPEEAEEEDEETREQRLLFEVAHREREARLLRAENFTDYVSGPQSNEEVFQAIWPQFIPGVPLRFGELLPGKKAQYLGKAPLKPPKPIHPTKVNLELEPDQERLFRTPAGPPLSLEDRLAEAEAKGIVLTSLEETKGDSSDDEQELGLLDTGSEIGGVSWPDLVTICQDWDVPDAASSISNDIEMNDDDNPAGLFLDEDEFDTLENARPSKRRRLDDTVGGPLFALHNLNLAFDDPQKTTAKLARKVYLDMNDSLMLIDERPTALPQRRAAKKSRREAAGGLTQDLTRRYNISNDDEYDLLKQNHQHRVRSQVGNTPVVHAGVAVRLQYPFYKQHLSRKEARSWHRPALNVIPGVVLFRKPTTQKRKLMRTREPADAYAHSKDLSVGDNSHVALFEYSEETPPMLNSFGMGSRLINYYRRKDNEDTARPKLDTGETAVLLPQDKSPFDIFGTVDAGQLLPTLSNSMYRAPVFKHSAKPTDFLVSKNSTGRDGAVWHLRNIDNLHVVGQEFPFVEVPGPKARFSTNIAKGRLQMVSYRMYNRSRGKLTMDMVRKHNPHTDIPTIRTKMREFMNFDKSAGQGKGVWVPKHDFDIPDEANTRGLVRPEDVSLLYAMQVGQQHLSDAGYHRQGDYEDVDEENEDGNVPAGNIDRQLAPWNTTKAFLHSCADKAMIEVYGDGDPTGRGEGFSMIKTSMKGGFKAVGQSIEDHLKKRERELGGHKYNVAIQRAEYIAALTRVWQKQLAGLSSTEQHDDTEMGGAEEIEATGVATPAQGLQKSRREDDAASFVSRASSQDQTGTVLRITRVYKGKYGESETRDEVVTDPAVIREYARRRRVQQLENLSLGEMKPTGDPEQDALRKKILEEELQRLYRNSDRRLVREKAKGVNAGSPGDTGNQTPDEDGGTPSAGPRRKHVLGTTQRKCANCGMVGHIKTNKKLCPMLNGTRQASDAAGESAFGSIANPASSSSQTNATQVVPDSQDTNDGL